MIRLYCVRITSGETTTHKYKIGARAWPRATATRVTATPRTSSTTQPFGHEIHVHGQPLQVQGQPLHSRDSTPIPQRTWVTKARRVRTTHSFADSTWESDCVAGNEKEALRKGKCVAPERRRLTHAARWWCCSHCWHSRPASCCRRTRCRMRNRL